MTLDLRPCPFCGAAGEALREVEIAEGRFVTCDRCGAWGPLAYRSASATEAGLVRRAIELWNSRYPHPPPGGT